MAIHWGDTGKVAVGTYKEFNFTSTFYEDISVYAAPVTLPIARPTTPQFTLTINASHMPTVKGVKGDNFPRLYYKVKPFLHVSGRNVSGASTTVTVAFRKNGTDMFQVTSPSLPNNNYWTGNYISSTLDTNIGDVFEIFAWSAVTGVNYSYFCFFNAVDAFYVPTTKVLQDVTFHFSNMPHTITPSPTNVSWTGANLIYPHPSTLSELLGSSSPEIYSVYKPHPDMGVFRLQASQNTFTTHATNIVQRTSNRVMTKLSYRELL